MYEWIKINKMKQSINEWVDEWRVGRRKEKYIWINKYLNEQNNKIMNEWSLGVVKRSKQTNPGTGHLGKCEGAIPHFWANIGPNRIILAKLHYYELLVKIALFCTFLHFLAKIALLWSKILHFSRCPAEIYIKLSATSYP